MTVNEDLLQQYEQTRVPAYRIYEPESTIIVMGAGRKGKGDTLDLPIRLDAVPVLMRKGGGGTVVLSAGMLVLALVTEVRSTYNNLTYARAINEWFREVLESRGVRGIRHQGISDLALGDKKILGTSIFRRRNILFYQASLLVSNDVGLFSRYLAFPSTVPEYRGRRDHRDFCVTLREAGHPLEVAGLSRDLDRVVQREMTNLTRL